MASFVIPCFGLHLFFLLVFFKFFVFVFTIVKISGASSELRTLGYLGFCVCFSPQQSSFYLTAILKKKQQVIIKHLQDQTSISNSWEAAKYQVLGEVYRIQSKKSNLFIKELAFQGTMLL